MKDATGGLLKTFFISLLPKMCTYLINGEKCAKKAKGIKFSVFANKISFQDYVGCLREYKDKTFKQRTNPTFALNLFSVE